jgi:prophage antirepressor-like protein
MSNLIPFEFETNNVRVIMDDNNEPWFVAKDVAKALGYTWNGVSRIAHVPQEWRGAARTT